MINTSQILITHGFDSSSIYALCTEKNETISDAIYESELLGFVNTARLFTIKLVSLNHVTHFIHFFLCECYMYSRTNRIFWPLLVHRMSNSKLLLSKSANVEPGSMRCYKQGSFKEMSDPVHPEAKRLVSSEGGPLRRDVSPIPSLNHECLHSKRS